MTDDTVAADQLHQELSIDQRLAMKTAASNLRAEFGDMFGVETIERFLHSSYDQFADRATVPVSCRCWPNGLRANDCAPSRASRVNTTMASRRYFSCARTTPGGRRWRWASSLIWPAMRRSRGPAAPSPASRSIRRPSMRCLNGVSTSRTNTRSPGRMRSRRPRTSSSRWAAATLVRSFRDVAMKTGTSTTPLEWG